MKIRKQNKHRNKPTYVDGIRFASKVEARRYCELKLLKKSGDVLWFIWQVPFVLSPDVRYYADFLVVYREEGVVIEDVKGRETDVFKIKKKLMKEVHGIDIKIIKYRRK